MSPPEADYPIGISRLDKISLLCDLCAWFIYVKNYFQCFPAKRGKNIFKIALVTENVTFTNPGV
jgi:hypothetical protein